MCGLVGVRKKGLKSQKSHDLCITKAIYECHQENIKMMPSFAFCYQNVS